MMKFFCFLLGVVVTICAVSWLEHANQHEDPTLRYLVREHAPTTREPSDPPSATERASLRPEPVASAATGDRTSIPSVDELEQRIVAELIAELPPDWITPIEPPTTGDGPTLGGVPHGEWTIHYPLRDWTEKGRFVLGSKQGRWEMFDAQGELVQVLHYRNGKKDGEVSERDAVTGEWNTWTYRDGKLQDR